MGLQLTRQLHQLLLGHTDETILLDPLVVWRPAVLSKVYDAGEMLRMQKGLQALRIRQRVEINCGRHGIAGSRKAEQKERILRAVAGAQRAYFLGDDAMVEGTVVGEEGGEAGGGGEADGKMRD
jgi:hypothetical protein